MEVIFGFVASLLSVAGNHLIKHHRFDQVEQSKNGSSSHAEKGSMNNQPI